MGKVVKSAKNVVKKFDPTTTEGLANLGTGGWYGVTKKGAEIVGAKFINNGMNKFEKEGDRAIDGVKDGVKDLFGGPGDPKATESEKVAAQVAAKEYDFARQLDFVKDEYAKRVEQLGTQQMQDSVTGRANIDAQAQVNDLANKAQLGLSDAGIDPSSARAATTMTAVQDASGNASGRAQSESAFALDSAYLEGQNNRIAMAMGEKTKAVAGLQDIAAGANSKSIAEARNKFNSRAATSAALGTAAGMAGQYYLGQRTPKDEG